MNENPDNGNRPITVGRLFVVLFSFAALVFIATAVIVQMHGGEAPTQVQGGEASTTVNQAARSILIYLCAIGLSSTLLIILYPKMKRSRP